MNRISLTFIITAFTFLNFATAQTIPPKREFRAVWVASVSNIDWPTSKNLTPTQQRNEIVALLDKQKLNGMNAVVVQIRPSCDAFYGNAMEPWSEWLTGTQGTPPNPLYDPLAFIVEETKKRGMELHAWFNPYRAVVNKNSSSVHSSHVSNTHPQWIQVYDVLKVLDPGIPAVREYVIKVIVDVVKRYDIQGVHFDDYFYPYPKSGVPFLDSLTFVQYPNGFTDREDWRRNNINLLVKMLSDSIKAYKPWVKFGISPFGIWKNNTSDPLGSATTGFESYFGIYADSRKWMEEGWLDYINPQIYWSIGFNAARYEVLVPWWVNNSFGRHLYIGQAAYKIGSTSDPNWQNLSMMPNEIRLNRAYPNVHGSVFFSSKSITNNLGGFQDSLRNNLYKYPALIPTMPWKDSVPPNPPQNFSGLGDSMSLTLNWERPTPASDNDSAKYFVLYRFNHPDSINLNDPRKILFISAKDTTSYVDHFSGVGTPQYIYALSSFDKLHNESSPVFYYFNTTAIKRLAINPTEYGLEQNFPNPFNPITTIRFTLPENSFVTLKIYDVTGEEIFTLINEELRKGKHEIEFNADSLSSGTYIYQLRTESFVQSRKMLILK